MKTYPYNKASAEGRRLYRLLGAQFNKATLDSENNSNVFTSYDVPVATQCRVNSVRFLFDSNATGIKRPHIQVVSDVEMAWGDFSEEVSSLDFTHDDQELPLSYIQPLEDETIKMLIDAGLYREDRFEELMNKLMSDEVFDAEAEMQVTYLKAKDETTEEDVPILLVDPVSVVHVGYDPSEQTTIANLVKRSALLALELQKEGVRTEELVSNKEPDQDREVFLESTFEDVLALNEEREQEATDSISTSSVLLDEEIDVTEELKDSLSIDHTSEDDRIRDLKARERYEEEQKVEKESIEEAYNELSSDLSVEDETLDVVPETATTKAEYERKSKTKEAETTLDSDMFSKGLDDYEFDSEDDGPEL